MYECFSAGRLCHQQPVVAESTTPTLLSPLFPCRLLFPVVSLKIFSIPNFASNFPNKIFIFSDSFDLKINSQKLPKSESTKYQGVYMDNKLSWKNHVEHTINKVNQRLRLIKRLAGATGYNEHHV